MGPRQTHRPRYRLAAMLGAALAAGGAVGAGLLLSWSVSGLTSAAGGHLPVVEGLVLLTGLAAGLVAVCGAYLAGAGALTLLKRACGGDETPALLTPRLTARSAAVLLVLVMGSPVANAETSTLGCSRSAEISAGAASILAHPGESAPTPPAQRGPDDRDNGNVRVGTGSADPTRPALPVPLPGWQSTRKKLAVAEAPPEESAAVVVQRGDTLWAIASADLAPGASDAQIAAHWPRWYEANRLTIGPDPDLLLPGQILHPPTPRGAHP
ncbi:MAG: hypothetical protein WA966_14390 [Ornithinimicrobium sp.]